jgi:uncharacterized protein (DUF302 family)
MRDESRLIHCEHVSTRSFDEVVAAFEGEIGHAEVEMLRRAVEGSSSRGDFEARIKALEGRSGFMLFFEADHGGWMARVGLKARGKMYVIGNPLIARTMIEHEIGVGLNVPVRVLIYEDPKGRGVVAYDLPSSLMERLKNDQVTAAARRLDEKLAALAEIASGVAA